MSSRKQPAVVVRPAHGLGPRINMSVGSVASVSTIDSRIVAEMHSTGSRVHRHSN